MSSSVDAASLCSTCSKMQVCSLRSGKGRIVCCDEYDGPRREPLTDDGPRLENSPKDKPPVSNKGLCPTCALKTSCARRDEAIGVWRCKDYR
jgi:hypothetical protein